MDENPYKAPQEPRSDATGPTRWTTAARRIGFSLAVLPWLTLLILGKFLRLGVLYLIFRWGLEPTSILAVILCVVGMIHPPRRLAIIGLVSIGVFWGIFWTAVLSTSLATQTRTHYRRLRTVAKWRC